MGGGVVGVGVGVCGTKVGVVAALKCGMRWL